MAPDNGFFTPATYKGAFGDVNWLADWSILSQVQILTSNDAGTPKAAVVPSGPSAPTLSITQNGTEVEISFLSENGVSYQLQSALTATNPTAWSDDGAPVAGDGSIIMVTRSISGSMVYQVLAQ